MSGGGGSSAPSTQTQITDVPAWMRGYMENALGKAQTISDQPYQQYNGPQVAGFTPDQLSAFSQIKNLGSQVAPTQQAALGSANAGASSVGDIYNAGAGNINASTGYNPLAAVAPFLGQSTNYDSAAAAQPWLNQAAGFQGAAAQAGTPQGIQSYMSPYTDSVVRGIQDQANQNWNQNIMPGINDKFVGAGQSFSGRNAQVLGQAAGNFQTGLSANVANALQSGYSTAGQQAAQQAQLLSGLGSQSLTGASTASNAAGQQVSNLLNTANAAGTATNQQAQNLQNAGTALGNLKATQAGQQLAAGTTLGNLAQQQQQMGITGAQALQATGQQQQQLNQTNLDIAKQNWTDQYNYPKEQVQWMTNILRGLPQTATSTTSQATPAYSTSPLAALGGSAATALTLSGSLNAKKKGGLIKKYADGGLVDDDEELYSPLDALVEDPVKADKVDVAALQNVDDGQVQADNAPNDAQAVQQAMAQPVQESSDVMTSPLNSISEEELDRPSAKHDIGAGAPESEYDGKYTKAEMQRNQLLSIARGLLTPQRGGSFSGALGAAVGNLQDTEMAQRKFNADIKDKDLDRDIKKELIDQGRFTPVKDMFGNVTGVINTKTGALMQLGQGVGGMPDSGAGGVIDMTPSADPQKAALQILDESGTPFTPIASRQDITGRNTQAKGYRDSAMAAKKVVQELNSLNSQTGKYDSGTGNAWLYKQESSIGMGGKKASARAEADKASSNLANAFMNANAGAKGSGIRMLEFDAKAVPNPDMPDEARTDLINKNLATANTQIQRGVISDMYPRMHIANVNAIMDNYEEKNPPLLADSKPNTNWMPYKEWLKAGRPNTGAMEPKAEKTDEKTEKKTESKKTAKETPIAVNSSTDKAQRIAAIKAAMEKKKPTNG